MAVLIIIGILSSSLLDAMNQKNKPLEEFKIADVIIAPDFDWEFYAATNKETKLTKPEDLYNHYLQVGKAQGKLPRPSPPETAFNWVYYVQKYADLRANNITTKEAAYRHYLMFGKKEGRQSQAPRESYEVWLQHRTPLPVVLDSSQPVRLNILMCGVGFDFTGGPLSIFHFAVLAAKQGINVRWINIDNSGISEKEMVTHMKKYDGLGEFGDLVPYIRDGQHQLEIRTNPDDIFMATIYFTALMASATQKLLNYPYIIYFIQDFEPIFFPKNSDFIEAMESYDVPHFAIYSTTILRDYFEATKQGTYQWSKRQGDFRSYASMPAIKPFGEVVLTPHKPGKKRRLVMYARPHAPRNAFELSVSALSEAIRQDILNPDEWEFIGLGATGSNAICGLGGKPNACLVMAKNMPEPQYKAMLMGADIGISLMISPHPSLPPFDFAAAGCVTVTNSFETKTQESFDKVSKNIIAAKPSLVGIVHGIKLAVSRINDLPSRLEGAKLQWSTRWDDDGCYGDPLFKGKIRKWMRHRG